VPSRIAAGTTRRPRRTIRISRKCGVAGPDFPALMPTIASAWRLPPAVVTGQPRWIGTSFSP
jgi:hypothetical protein